MTTHSHSVTVASSDVTLAPARNTTSPTPSLAGAHNRKRAVTVQPGPVEIPVTQFSFRTFHGPDSRRGMVKSDETTMDKIITVSMPFIRFGTKAAPSRIIQI